MRTHYTYARQIVNISFVKLILQAILVLVRTN